MFPGAAHLILSWDWSPGDPSLTCEADSPPLPPLFQKMGFRQRIGVSCVTPQPTLLQGMCLYGCGWECISIFKKKFIDYAITVVPFFPPLFPFALNPAPPAFPHFSSCPWAIHISSLASPFPVLFLTSSYCVPTIYASYSLCLSLLLPPPSPHM